MLPTAWIDQPLEEVFNLLIVGHLSSLLDLLMEREQAGEKLRVVGRLADAERVKQVKGPLASGPRLALRQIGCLCLRRNGCERCRQQVADSLHCTLFRLLSWYLKEELEEHGHQIVRLAAPCCRLQLHWADLE